MLLLSFFNRFLYWRSMLFFLENTLTTGYQWNRLDTKFWYLFGDRPSSVSKTLKDIPYLEISRTSPLDLLLLLSVPSVSAQLCAGVENIYIFFQLLSQCLLGTRSLLDMYGMPQLLYTFHIQFNASHDTIWWCTRFSIIHGKRFGYNNKRCT